MISLRKTFVMLSLLGLSGCGDDDLPDYFLLDRLRVLAAQTSGAAAEFAPGDSPTVVFHVSDPKGAGRTLTYSMEACVDPGVSQGATPSCTGNATLVTLVASSTFVPGSAATNYYGTLSSPAVSIPGAGVIFLDPRTGSARPTSDQANGVAYLVTLRITASATETATAFKRLVVSTKTTKNQNPSWSATPILFDGVAPGSYTLTTARFPVRAQVAAASAESYVVTNVDLSTRPAEEDLTITWFVSSGEMRFSRTEPSQENRFTPAQPLPAVTSFIAVLRDDRGGTAVVDFHQ